MLFSDTNEDSTNEDIVFMLLIDPIHENFFLCKTRSEFEKGSTMNSICECECGCGSRTQLRTMTANAEK